MTDCKQSRTIGIAAWCALAHEGSAPPVTICLDGSSMMPLIRRGKDPVTIAPLQREVKVGDVVLFTTGAERYVVHRVWKKQGDKIRTLGDNCLNPDPWITMDSVLGQAVLYRRNGRKHRLDTPAARLFGRVWLALYPVRKRCIRLKFFLYKCLKRIWR